MIDWHDAHSMATVHSVKCLNSCCDRLVVSRNMFFRSDFVRWRQDQEDAVLPWIPRDLHLQVAPGQPPLPALPLRRCEPTTARYDRGRMFADAARDDVMMMIRVRLTHT